jgi:hypothetical protein
MPAKKRFAAGKPLPQNIFSALPRIMSLSNHRLHGKNKRVLPLIFSVKPVIAHLSGYDCQKSSVWAALSILRHPKQPRHCCLDFKQGGGWPL